MIAGTEIVIFKELTTNEYLDQLDIEAEKYSGLYVDMYKAEQRKFVKDKADLISTMLKKLERARIDKTKDFKLSVESEANRIKERLEAANVPFTALINEHKKARALELEREKQIQAAKDLLIKIEEDHENAITLDKIRTFEIQDAIRQQEERDEALRVEARAQAEREKIAAEERAEQAELDKIMAIEQARRDKIAAEEREKQAKIDADLRAERMAEEAKQREIDRQAAEQSRIDAEKAKLEADKKHVGAIRCEIKKHIMKDCNIDEGLAVRIVKSLLKTQRITINY